MGVENNHPLYESNLYMWVKCRVAVSGEDAVKAAGDTYLPILSGMDGNEYEAYKKRASFFDATSRTVEGMTGAVFRKPYTLKAPAALESRTTDEEGLGEGGESLEQLMGVAVEEALTTGRVGGYVDAGPEENAEPYICIYYAENIVNWQYTKIGGEKILTLVVLCEMEEVREDDGFKVESREIRRVLRLTGSSAGLTYQVEVWEEEETTQGGKTQSGWVMRGEPVIPKRRGGKSFEYIPFAFATPKNTSGEQVEKPPILGLVNLNFSHYRNSADLEHGLHFTALPTAYAVGFEKTNSLRIGSAVAWISDNDNAKAGYLEFSGSGLGAITAEMEKKEKRMAVVGSRLLEDQKKAQEAAVTVQLRHVGEGSVLSKLAGNVSEMFTKLLTYCADWMGEVGSEIKVELSKEYTSFSVDPTMLTALNAAVLSGNMSWDAFYFNLKRGDMLPDNWTVENERAAIEKGRPMGAMEEEGAGAGPTK